MNNRKNKISYVTVPNIIIFGLVFVIGSSLPKRSQTLIPIQNGESVTEHNRIFVLPVKMPSEVLGSSVSAKF